jgi:hypothetical protein
VGQVKTIEIKEAAEKGRNGETKTAEKKRNINHRLVGILCRNSDPVANPPRTKLPRGKDPDGHKVEKVRLGDNRHWLSAKGNWLLESIGGITTTDELEAFRLGAISILPANRVGDELQRESEGRKQELGHEKQRRLKAQYLWDIPEPDTVSKSAQSAPGSCFQNTSAPHHHSVVTSKTPGVPHHHSAVISKTPMLSSVARHLPLKCRRCLQSLGVYL